jgi:hypothetical protein
VRVFPFASQASIGRSLKRHYVVVARRLAHRSLLVITLMQRLTVRSKESGVLPDPLCPLNLFFDTVELLLEELLLANGLVELLDSLLKLVLVHQLAQHFVGNLLLFWLSRQVCWGINLMLRVGRSAATGLH